MQKVRVLLFSILLFIPLLFQNCSGSGGSILGNPLRLPVKEISLKYLAYDGSPQGAVTSIEKLDFCTKYIDLRYNQDPGDVTGAERIPGGDGSAIIRYSLGRQVTVDQQGAFLSMLGAPRGIVSKVTVINLPPSHPQNANSDCTFNGNLRVNDDIITSKFHEISFLGEFNIEAQDVFGFSLQSLVDLLAQTSSSAELDEAVVGAGYYSPWWDIGVLSDASPLMGDGSFTVGSGANVVVQGARLKLREIENRSILPQENLLAYWSMDDIMSEHISDQSGHSQNLNLVGSDLNALQPGKIENAVRIKSSERYLELSSSGSFNNLAQLSVVAWIKPRTSSGSNCGTIVSKKTHSYLRGWRLGFDGSTRKSLGFYVSHANEHLEVQTQETIQMGNWTHVVLTWGGSSQALDAKIYINGKLAKNALVKNGAGARDDDQEANILIGADASSVTRNCIFDGMIDEVAVWSQPLPANVIQSLYDKQYGKYHPFGHYVSKVYDSFNDQFVWGKFVPIPLKPYGKELVAKDLVENVAYAEGGLSTAGLTSLWHLNSNLKDDSGNLHSANQQGENIPAYDVGALKDAAKFDGSTNHIEITPHENFNFSPTAKYAWSLWLRPEAFAANTTVWSQVKLGSHSISILAHDNPNGVFDGVRFNLIRGVEVRVSQGVAGELRQATHDAVLTLNRWQHIGVTYDGSLPQTERIRIYINGINQTDPGRNISNGELIQLTPNRITLGATAYNETTAAHYFRGAIDEVSTWSRHLSDSEMRYLYERGMFRVYYQVRSCNDANCDGESFVGPGAKTGSYFSESLNSFASIPLFLLSGVIKPNRYFQYKVQLETLNQDSTPELLSIEVQP